MVADPVLPSEERALDRWFNTQSFRAPAPMTIGNSPKFPDIQGPGLINLDASLIRSIPIREQMRFELRGDFFNVLNRTNFSPPNGTFGTPTFGQVTGARLPRTIQIGGKFWF
jgi:hypothetical protein